jgi:hypothetical protein
MTGFESKRQAAQAKLDDDDDTQVYADTLLIVYQRGFADGKAAQPEQQAEPFSAVSIPATVTAWKMGYEAAKAEMQPEQEPCIGKDPRCPCQDGDACHYKDCGDTKARPVPLAQPEQEPVAWAVQGITQMIRGEFAELDAKSKAKRIGGTCVAYPLYTAPPQRTWVGLTDEDWDKVGDMPDTFDQGAAWAAARLKERNT